MVEAKDGEALGPPRYTREETAMVRVMISSIAAVLLILAPSSPRAGEEIPLSEQLGGLDPGARLAYVRHLISEGRDDAEVFFQAAVAFHEMGEVDSALHYYSYTIVKDPMSYKAYVNKGVLLDDMGDYPGALESFASAVAVKPDDVLAHSHLSFLLFENGDYHGAWSHLSKALEIDPEHPQVRFYLAIFFWESRIYREAIREWEKVIELEPDGFLAAKARENIVMLQNALNSPAGSTDWEPER